MVFAAARYGVNSPGNPFHFEVTLTKQGEQWNNATSIFTVKEAHGVYFVGLSVGVYDNRQSDLNMVLPSQRYAGVTRTSTNNQNIIDIIGRDVITELYAEETVHVSTSHPVHGGSSQDTTLTIFSITNSMMNQPVAFSVAREDSISGSADPVPFGVTLYNAGFHYDLFSHAFIATTPGVYYFSFSLGLIAGGRGYLSLHKNFEPFANIRSDKTNHNGTDTIGRSVMMELDRDDTIHIVNPYQYTARSSELKETSFCGFKYEPKHGNSVKLW